MNSPQLSDQDLTAYALGELPADQAANVSAWLEQHPEDLEHVESVESLGSALFASAPAPTYQLHPHQRQAVLAGGPQRVREMVAAASASARAAQAQRQRLAAWRSAKYAAAAAVTIGAFIAGTHYGPAGNPQPTVVALPEPSLSTPAAQPVRPAPAPAPAKKDSAPVVASVQAAQPAAAPVIALAAKASPPATSTPLANPQPAVTAKPAAPAMQASATLVSATLVSAPAPVEAKTPEATSATRAPRTQVFSLPLASTARGGLSTLTLRPHETRPLPPKADASQLGAPLPLDQKGKAEAPRPANAKAPELLIHAWKAEVSSCPWNEARRLVRLVLQLPGEQAAATQADFAYALQVNFEPNYVRSYRLLAQRAITPASRDAAAIHIAWYEITPNGTTTEGSARALGRVELPGARFTTQAMSPFDSTALQIIDRAGSWKSTREDYLFESALVGFGLLLKGEKDIGTLDHALVLALAEKSLSDDRNGERARFVKLVRQAQQSAGL